MNKEELLKELEDGFSEMKRELGFKSSFKDIDSIFFIRDFILSQKFVSPTLSRQICSRICDTYTSWISYLHGLIIPNPQNLINLNEAKMFNENERKEIMVLIKKAVALVNKNQLAGLMKDKNMEKEFIDESVLFWKKSFGPKLIDINKKINDGWKNDSENK